MLICSLFVLRKNLEPEIVRLKLQQIRGMQEIVVYFVTSWDLCLKRVDQLRVLGIATNSLLHFVDCKKCFAKYETTVCWEIYIASGN